ncbi:MAG: PKD domain-containing protein [Gemmatimonadales bacterium]
MRPLQACALLVGVAAAGTACGGDNNNGPSNNAPTAAFSAACPSLTCTFTDASSDPDAGDAVASWDWDFGDNSTHSTEKNPAHLYAQAGSFHVKLVVKDGSGLASAAADSLVVVSGGNQPPTASFTVQCDGEDCTFTDASSDPEGGALTYDWDFGDGSAHGTDQNPQHSYSVTDVSPFTVTLIVTDDQGATATSSQDITVTPPAQCNTGSTCTLDITSQAIVTVTLSSHDCELAGNRLAVTAPIQQTIFANGCSAPLPFAPVTLNGPNSDKSFAAGTQIQLQFTQGVGDPTDPTRGPPSIQLTGTFPDWTLNIDDGGDPTGPGEPDFNDLIVTVHAGP